ncbi:MAG: FeoB-associated Cys-rich membrane protein [Spirochaetales bacterium]|nr:FeoB-associated Cys-rich membrane protein [Spirochaetales bacterium]
MNIWDIMIIAAIAAVLVLGFVISRRRRKKGCGSCCQGCEGCPMKDR